MPNSNIDSSKELIDSVTKLIEKLENFPLTEEIVYLISAIVVFSFVYIMTTIIIKYKKNSKMERLLEKNTDIIGQCKEVMRNVCTALEQL